MKFLLVLLLAIIFLDSNSMDYRGAALLLNNHEIMEKALPEIQHILIKNKGYSSSSLGFFKITPTCKSLILYNKSYTQNFFLLPENLDQIKPKIYTFSSYPVNSDPFPFKFDSSECLPDRQLWYNTTHFWLEDYLKDKHYTFAWKRNCTFYPHMQYDGFNQNGFVFLVRSRRGSYSFCFANIDPIYSKKNNKAVKKTHYESFVIEGNVTATALNYTSEKALVTVQKDGQYALDYYHMRSNTYKKDQNKVILNKQTYYLPTEFIQCAWLTQQTGIGVTFNGDVYTAWINNDNEIRYAKQMISYSNKEKCLISRIAVNPLNPKQIMMCDMYDTIFFTDITYAKKNSIPLIKIYQKSKDCEQDKIERLFFYDHKYSFITYPLQKWAPALHVSDIKRPQLSVYDLLYVPHTVQLKPKDISLRLTLRKLFVPIVYYCLFSLFLTP